MNRYKRRVLPYRLINEATREKSMANLTQNEAAKRHEFKELVFNTLVYVLKEKKMYGIFRASIAITPFSQEDLISALFHSFKSFNYITNASHSDLQEAMNYNDFIAAMDLYCNMPLINSGKDEEERDQLYILECVNLILHNCLERSIPKEQLKCLEEIGHETFNRVCEKVFGKDFKDKTTKCCENISKNISKLGEYLKMDKNQLAYLSDKDLMTINNFYGDYRGASWDSWDSWEVASRIYK